ncbi:MAG: hypothetical protein N3G19_00775 [Candidatus Pacearchaeota archaeon]|nr:hypothetical protein [Candidatus Pacearchaeota archaeon]
MLKIEEGIIMSYWCFDVGNEIKIDEIEKVLGKKAEKILLTYERLIPEYVQYKTPPLFIRAGKERISGKEWALDIKIYDFGVITVRIWTPIKGIITEITKELNKIESELKKIAFNILNKTLKEIENYIYKPVIEVEKTFSNYNVFFVQRFDKAWKSSELVKRFGSDLVHFLRYENKKLSEQEIRDVLKASLSYYSDDLTIIDFNSALIYDPRKSYDVLDVIEYVIIELTELRAYDNFLDSVLETTYEELSKKKFFAGGAIINKLSQIKLEISEVKEKVEQITGLDYQRFLRSVMLAQGDFSAFLKADEKSRGELLEKITGTEKVANKKDGSF